MGKVNQKANVHQPLKTKPRVVSGKKPNANNVLATLIPAPSVYVGRLSTTDDWARELSRLYRQMRKGIVPSDIGGRLAYVGRIAAELVRSNQEIEELQSLRAKLEAIQGGSSHSLGFNQGDLVDGSTVIEGGLSAPTSQEEPE